jgi:transcriptional regulator with XRE-family HTH domain
MLFAEWRETLMAELAFGDWIKRRRLAARLTQEQLARQIGCAAITLRKIEADERRPSAQIAELLAKALAIPSADRPTFLRFARGDWTQQPAANTGSLPWHTPPVPRSNLPAAVTALIGREEAMALVRSFLQDTKIRLVTLIGPPGIGKTSLSLESARAALPDFPAGVFFVALAALADAALVPAAIVQALGYVETKALSVRRQLVESIGDKQMLIVLDNCEHLIEGVASLTSEILSACPRSKILVTSRESLR